MVFVFVAREDERGCEFAEFDCPGFGRSRGFGKVGGKFSGVDCRCKRLFPFELKFERDDKSFSSGGELGTDKGEFAGCEFGAINGIDGGKVGDFEVVFGGPFVGFDWTVEEDGSSGDLRFGFADGDQVGRFESFEFCFEGGVELGGFGI